MRILILGGYGFIGSHISNYLKKDKTIILITHQTENLKYCDIIYRIKEKKIILEKNDD